MVATGRTFGAAKIHTKAAGVTRPSIFYDGARLMTPEGKEVRSSLFDLSVAEELLDFLWTFPAEIQVAGDETVSCREKDLDTIRFYRKAGVPVDFIASPSVSGPVYRIALWLESGELPAVEEKVRAAFGARTEVISSGANFLDVLPKGVSKGSALEDFVATLPRRPEVIVAAGDHKNDLTMLARADVAAVPSNAFPGALSLAHIVMPGAAENGICALTDYLLSPGFSVPKARKGPPSIL
jgi:HAD superfamily hydrolase (TIGR01484 family)